MAGDQNGGSRGATDASAVGHPAAAAWPENTGEMVRRRSRTDICPSTVSRTLHPIRKQETISQCCDVLAVWQPKAASLVCFDASTIRQYELACVSDDALGPNARRGRSCCLNNARRKRA
jgi:hypothetical protein